MHANWTKVTFFILPLHPFFSEPQFNDDDGHLSIHMMHRKLFPCRSRSKAVLISRRPTSCVTSPCSSSSLLMHFSARIGMSVLGLIPPKADPMRHLPNRSSRAGTHNRSVWFPSPRMIVLPLPCQHQGQFFFWSKIPSSEEKKNRESSGGVPA